MENLTPWEPQSVPKGHYFLVGEQIEGLNASRYVGLHPAKQVAERVRR